MLFPPWLCCDWGAHGSARVGALRRLRPALPLSVHHGLSLAPFPLQLPPSCGTDRGPPQGSPGGRTLLRRGGRGRCEPASPHAREGLPPFQPLGAPQGIGGGSRGCLGHGGREAQGRRWGRNPRDPPQGPHLGGIGGLPTSAVPGSPPPPGTPLPFPHVTLSPLTCARRHLHSGSLAQDAATTHAAAILGRSQAGHIRGQPFPRRLGNSERPRPPRSREEKPQPLIGGRPERQGPFTSEL